MNKLRKVFLTLQLIFQKPSLINLIIDSDYFWSKKLQEKYPNKTQLPVVAIEELIPNFNETLNCFSFLGGGSLATDLMLIKALCKQTPNCTYFEIGTWRGESVANIADVVTEAFTLNLSKEQLLNLGLPSKYADLHGFFSKQFEHITHLFGDTLQYDFSALQKKFDVIFIDGDHTYPYVKNDTEKVFKHLVKENTVVIWHDYAYHPEKVRSEVLYGILEGIPKQFANHIYHVSNTQCAIFTIKKIRSDKADFPTKPEKTFKVSATIKKI